MSGNGGFEREERNEIVQRAYALEQQLYPAEGQPERSAEERADIRERFYLALGEYSDRLPRVRLSVCPYCESPLKRVFDPFGLDGPWWHVDAQVGFDEPAACEHFRRIQGALALNGRVPTEARDQVRPGPEPPFVIPTLLELPGMLAVVGRIGLRTGDVAFPICYYSDQQTFPQDLHQPWLRSDVWFEDAGGNTCWYTSNDTYEFDLGPFAADRRLRWVHLDRPEDRVWTVDDEPCPFLDLPGDRERQQIVHGERELIGLPSGEPLNPFEE